MNMLLIVLALVWTLGAAVGSGYSMYLVAEAHRDKTAVAEFKATRGRTSADIEVLAVLADSHFRSELNRLATQSLAFAVGFLALVYSNADPTPTPIRIVSRLGITVAVFLVYANSVLNAHARRRVVAMQLRNLNTAERGK